MALPDGLAAGALHQASKRPGRTAGRGRSGMYETTYHRATSVADAIVLAEGRRLPSSAEKLLTSVMNNFSKLSDRDRRAVYAAHEDEIRSYAQEKGWL